jgi:hypothetical protein
LDNFAKIIISTRLNPESPAIRKWIQNPDKYSKYLDRNLLLLKMDIYSGKIPDYLTDEDHKRFDHQIRKEILAASDQEGNRGISGRMSLNIFNDFMATFNKNNKLITMEIVYNFFSQNEKLYKDIPIGFLSSLVDLYDYNVLQEVKEAIYYYNESQISRDIMNYLFFVNYETGDTEKCVYTGDTITVSEDFFKNFEAFFLGTTSLADQRKSFRMDVQKDYISKTIAREMNLDNKKLNETEQYKNLFEKYTKNLKENALAPYIDNDTFRRAVIDWGTASFNSYDDRMKRDVTLLIKNLISKFNYTEEGARQVSIYVLDKKLARKY